MASIAPEFQSQYMDAINGIVGGGQFQSIPTSAVQDVLSQGGGLANSLGYNSPVDMAGLTPEMFNHVMQNRSNIMDTNSKQLSDATKIADQLYGIPQAREAALKGAGMTMEGQIRNQEQQQQFEHADKSQAAGFANEDLMFGKKANLEKEMLSTRQKFEEILQDKRLSKEEKIAKLHIASSQYVAGLTDSRQRDANNIRAAEVLANQHENLTAFNGHDPRLLTETQTRFNSGKYAKGDQDPGKFTDHMTLMDAGLSPDTKLEVPKSAWASLTGGKGKVDIPYKGVVKLTANQNVGGWVVPETGVYGYKDDGSIDPDSHNLLVNKGMVGSAGKRVQTKASIDASNMLLNMLKNSHALGKYSDE